MDNLLDLKMNKVDLATIAGINVKEAEWMFQTLTETKKVEKDVYFEARHLSVFFNEDGYGSLLSMINAVNTYYRLSLKELINYKNLRFSGRYRIYEKILHKSSLNHAFEAMSQHHKHSLGVKSYIKVVENMPSDILELYSIQPWWV